MDIPEGAQYRNTWFKSHYYKVVDDVVYVFITSEDRGWRVSAHKTVNSPCIEPILNRKINRNT